MPEMNNELQKMLGNSNIFSTLEKNFQEMQKIIQAGADDMGKKSIITKFGDSENQRFVTNIRIGDEDIENVFPSSPPDASNAYWKRHNELVDTYLDARKQIVLKAIEVAGTTIAGLNPLGK